MLSSFAFNFNLRRYNQFDEKSVLSDLPVQLRKEIFDNLYNDALGRGLHSSTSQLNVSAFCGIGGAFGGYLGGV